MIVNIHNKVEKERDSLNRIYDKEAEHGIIEIQQKNGKKKLLPNLNY